MRVSFSYKMSTLPTFVNDKRKKCEMYFVPGWCVVVKMREKRDDEDKKV